MLKAAKSHSERDWLMILVAFWHGLRASEVIGLSGASVMDGFLTVQRLKGSLRTVQPLISHSEPLLSEQESLIELALNCAPNQRLFPVTRRTFYNVVARAAETAKLPAHKHHPHMLKHSIAMQTIHSAGIENVRQYLGHKSISSTGAYLKVSDSDASKAIAGALKISPTFD